MPKYVIYLLASLFVVFVAAPATHAQEVLASFPLDSDQGVLSPKDVTVDTAISSDGKASLRFDSPAPRVIPLIQIGDLDIENAKLVYRAKVRSHDLQGKAFLEMWCSFAGLGDYFSKGPTSTVTGSQDWTELETAFFLKSGENPVDIKLNIVIEGKGTVWIDDVRLIKEPLSASE